jgi:YEATS domain-containing protein 4
VIKIYYVPEASEKPQTLYHHLRLHAYGTDAEKEEMKQKGEVISWSYEEQLFNEPNEQFYELLTNPVDSNATGGKGKGKGTKLMRGGMVGSTGERTALIPLANRPGQPFSRETEKKEIRRMVEAKAKVDEMIKEAKRELEDAEKDLMKLKQG